MNPLKKLAYTFIFSLITMGAMAQQGRITGKVTDKKTGEELIGVSVQIEGTSQGAATDFEGKYNINIAPGTYTLVFSYLSYNKRVIKDVKVIAKETEIINVSMEESTKELNEVVIRAEVKKESANAVLVQQKNAVAVSSGVSADLIRKTPDRTTADVVKRISGASIQDNKFAVIRGLGDRYNMAFINGAPLASSESDRKAFSLDLIPASVMDNMMIVKTATPDMPGDFAGGFIQINTKDIPEEDQTTVGFNIGMHSLTTFKEGFGSPARGTADLFARGNDIRTVPNGVLNTELGREADVPTLVEQSKLFNNNFAPERIKSMSPNVSFNATTSRRFKTERNEFGVLASVLYSYNQRYMPFELNTPILGKDQTEIDITKADGRYYNYDNYRTTVNTGGVLNLSAKLGKNNKISFKNLFTQTGDDQTILRQGIDYVQRSGTLIEQEQRRFNDYLYMYQQSNMYTGQFSGEHYVTSVKLKLKYTAGYTYVNRSMPDYKRLIYQADKPVGDTVFQPSVVQLNPDANAFTPNQSGRFFSDLTETSPSVKYEASLPFKLFKKSEVKVGGFHHTRARTFTGRNFLITYDQNNVDPSITDVIGQLGPDQIFLPQNMGPTTYFQRETTQPSDSYTSSSRLHAAFVMLDNKITNRLRLIWGVRLENFNQKVNSEAQGRKVNVDQTNNDWLPSANIIYELSEKQNLRLGYARTLSRPEFREFAPLAFYEPNYNSIIAGNDTLVRATVDNFDLKWEFFPTQAQTISINPFLKQFVNPIEMGIVPNPSFRSFSYSNAYKAINYGVEFEVRLMLGDLVHSNNGILKSTTVYGNYAFIRSEVLFESTNITAVKKRPLQGQSPYVFNLGVNYSNPKLFDVAVNMNRIGERIALVANENNFIFWEKPRTVIDMSISRTFLEKLQVKLTVGDLLAQDLVWFQDLNGNRTYDEGKDVGTFIYKFGRTITIGLNYRF